MTDPIVTSATSTAQEAAAVSGIGAAIAKGFLFLVIGYLLGVVFPFHKFQCNASPIDSSGFKITVQPSGIIHGDTDFTPVQQKTFDSLMKIDSIKGE